MMNNKEQNRPFNVYGSALRQARLTAAQCGDGVAAPRRGHTSPLRGNLRLWHRDDTFCGALLVTGLAHGDGRRGRRQPGRQD